jgi:hypothetical protein
MSDDLTTEYNAGWDDGCKWGKSEAEHERDRLRSRLAEAERLLTHIETLNFDWGGPNNDGTLERLYAFLAGREKP